MSTIRRYPLTSTETRGSDTGYSLIFTEDGRMYVQKSVSYEQDYKTGERTDIFQESFSSYAVEGVPLGMIVGKKLDELLPPKPLAWPDVPHIS